MSFKVDLRRVVDDMISRNGQRISSLGNPSLYKSFCLFPEPFATDKPKQEEPHQAPDSYHSESLHCFGALIEHNTVTAFLRPEKITGSQHEHPSQKPISHWDCCRRIRKAWFRLRRVLNVIICVIILQSYLHFQ